MRQIYKKLFSTVHSDRSYACDIGGSFLRRAHRSHSRVIQAPLASSSRPCSRRTPTDFRSAHKFLRHSSLRQLNSARCIPDPSACPSYMGCTSVGRMAQCPMVLESHLQLLCCISWHHGQAMAQRAQHRTVWRFATFRSPPRAPLAKSGEVARRSHCHNPSNSPPARVGTVLRRLTRLALEHQCRCRRSRINSHRSSFRLHHGIIVDSHLPSRLLLSDSSGPRIVQYRAYCKAVHSPLVSVDVKSATSYHWNVVSCVFGLALDELAGA